MKFTITRPVEIDIAYVRIIVPFRYDGEEHAPGEDFPLRRKANRDEKREANFVKSKYDVWDATVYIENGQILDWPDGVTDVELDEKVCDEGVYILMDDERKEIAVIEDYVPDIVPGRYGDYIELTINAAGVITNWPKKPSLRGFFPGEDD